MKTSSPCPWIPAKTESVRVKRRNEFDECHSHAKYDICGMAFFSSICFKVGTHEGTSRRDLSQGLVRCRVYTMGRVEGTSPLKGLHAGTCYTLK